MAPLRQASLLLFLLGTELALGAVVDDTTLGCELWHLYDKPENCESILDTYNITSEQFQQWNKLSITDDCQGLTTGHSYCVKVTAESPPPESALERRNPKTVSKRQSWGLQPGVPSMCDWFHLVEPGQTCRFLAETYMITLQNVFDWNPQAGGWACDSLLANMWACVSVKGHRRRTCVEWKPVQRGDTCSSIGEKIGVTGRQLIEWNPVVGNECKTMWAGGWICVNAVEAGE